MFKKLSIITSNQEVGVLTSKTISNKLLLNAYNAFDDNSGSNSLIFELTSNEASISLYDEDTEIKTNVIELNNNYVNIPGNITFDGNINSISKNELNTLLNNDNNIKQTFTSHATNILNTSNHINDIDTKFITDITSLDTRISGNDTDISALDTRITANDTDISALDSRITNNETDITNTSNYLDKIESKTSNIEIIESGNIKLKSDLTITGELTVTDINVTGSSTQISTTTYQTENLQINNNQGDGPSLKIDHKNDDDDIIQIFNDTTRLFTIDPTGNVGIFNNDPQYSLDVTGNINFTGNLTHGGSAFASYIDSDVINLLELNHIKFNSNDIEIDEDFYIKNDNTLSVGDFKSEHVTINNDNNFTFKSSGTGPVQVFKIIIQGVSGSIDQNADVREFEFLGLNDGTNNYASGDRQSIISVTTTLPVAQYPSSPSVSTANWVDGNNLNYSQNSLNSYYIPGNNTINNTKNFTFTFTGSNKPNASLLTGFRIYYDRSDFSIDADWGTWDLIIEDQNGNQHTMINNMVFTEANAIDTTTQNYLEFTSGISYPQDVTFDNTIYDINKSDGILNIIYGLNVTSGNIGIGTATPDSSSKLHIYDTSDLFKVSNTAITTYKDILPATDDAIDLGSADKKFRDIYVGDNSLWVGDKHKIVISDGKMKFRKRKTDYIPDIIISSGGSGVEAMNYSGVQNANDMKLHHWLTYLRTLPSAPTKPTVTDLFRDTVDDYDEEIATDVWLHQTTNNNIYLGTNYTNVGIGNTNPQYTLDVDGDINISSGSSFKINGVAIATTDTTYTGGTGITISGTTINSDITQYTDSNVQNLLSTNLIKIGIGIAAHSTATLNIKGETRFQGTERNSYLNYSTNEHTYIRGGKNTSYVLLNDNGGNVGVGTETPQYTLDVSGNINFTGNLTKNGNAFTSYTDSDVLTLLNTTGVTGGLKVSSGNVGINLGSMTPKQNLSIDGKIAFQGDTFDGSCGMSYYHGTQTSERPFILFDNGGSTVIRAIDNNVNNGIKFQTYDGSTRIFINNNGNVGIGTLSPNYKLDIAGDINISSGSSFKINGVAIAITDTTYSAGTGISIDGTTINCDIVNTTSLVSDTTPQLGGDLDVNDKDIVSTSDKNININPAGNGNLVIKGNTTRGSGSIMLNCENNSHGVKIKGPPHSAGASYTLTLPPNVGSANQLLSTDGSGGLSFITPADGYTNSDVTTLLNSGVSGGIVSLNDLTVHGDIKKVTSGGSDPTINPSVSINNIDSTNKTIILQNTGNNQTSYAITFASNAICDILIVGGGGSGAQKAKAGAGAGGLVYVHNANITAGTYNILVGNGGTGNDINAVSLHTYRSGNKGFDSKFDNIIALGGGAGLARYHGAINWHGGSGGGGVRNSDQGDPNDPLYMGTSEQSSQNQNVSFTLHQYGNNGMASTWSAAAGGGAGGIGYQIGTHPEQDAMGGIGLSGISETGIDIDFKTHFGITDTSIGHHVNENGIDKVYFAAGGGGHISGANTPGQKGGGGGSANYIENINDYPEIYDALPNTGGGGGGISNTDRMGGGNGGSGIVIIRFASTTETIIESYSDDKVENVLANKGGTNITWNTNTKQFDCDVVNTDVDVSQANFDAKFNLKTVDNVSQANWDAKYNTTSIDTLDVSQANWDSKFDTTSRTIDDVSQANFNTKFTSRLNSDVTFNGHINLANGKNIKLGVFSYIGEDIDDQHSLSIIADYTENICFSGYDRTGTRPTTTNTTERMRIDRYGKVGIGTTAPSERLHLMHWDQITSPIDILTLEHNLGGNTTQNGTAIKFVSNWMNGDKHSIARIRGLSNDNTATSDNYFSGFLTFETQTGGTANDITSERMRITNIGNVGIGVTDPSEILHIIGNFRIETRPNETSSIDIKSDSGGFKIKYDDTNNNLKFITDNSGTEYELLTMDRSNNRIGIGTNLPEDDLHIKNGRIRIDNQDNTDNAVLNFKALSYNNWLFTDRTNGTFYIRTNNNKDFVLDVNGNIGVGTTNPTKLFTLRHPLTGGSTWDGFRLENNSGNQRIVALLSGASGTGDAYFNIYDNDGTSKIQLHNVGNTYFNGGNVGIGTTSPGSKLDVNGDVNVTGTITATNLDITGSTTTIHTDNYTTESLHIQSSGNDAVALKITHDTTNHDIIEVIDSSTNQVFTIDSSGNVGIGTDPTEKLDINGNIKFTGTINDITTTELSYLDGITENINTNFTNTSNHIDLIDSKFIILDHDNSNYILHTSNNLINYVNTSISENNFSGNANDITSGILDIDRLPIDGITIYKDGDVIKALTQETTDTSINAFIGTYINSTKYSENIDRASNIITIDSDKMVYDTSIINSTINTISDNPKFYTSEIIYPNNIFNINHDIFTDANPSFNDGIYQINIIASDGVLYDDFQRYGPHQLFNHILDGDNFYIGGYAFNQDGTYLGSNNFKNTLGLSISIDIGRSIYLRKMRFMPRKGTPNNCMPKFFKIFATNLDTAWNSPFDGSWTLIHDNTTEIQYNNNEFTNFGDFSNITSKYRYFTLVVTELNGNEGIMQMTEFSIIGVEDINNTSTLIDASNNTYTISLPYSDTTTVKTINDPKIRITVNDNLIAYYDFNGDYLDKNPTDTKYNLSVSGTPEFSQNTRIENQSVYFNQNNEFLSTSVNFPITFGTSFSFWFKRDNNTTHDILMAIGSDFFIMAHTDNKFYISNTYGGSEIYAFIDITLTSEWYHFVFIFDTDGTWKIYLNGIFYPLTTTGGTYPLTESRLPQGKLYIGGKDVGNLDVDHDLEGYIDNFRVYNKVLSSWEIYLISNDTVNNSDILEFNEQYVSYYNDVLYGLKAHYKLINNYNDSINTNDIISSVNSTFKNDELYYVNVPDGEFLTIPANACAPLFDTNKEHSFVFWVKVDTTTDDGNAIFGAIKNYGGGLYSRYLCQLSGTKLHWTRNYKRDSDGNLQDNASISCTFPNNLINKWVHLAFVSHREYDSLNHSKIYINGVQQFITHEYGLPSNNDISYHSDYLDGENLLLGGYIHSTGSARYHRGTEKFSDIRIYDRFLTSNDINQIINSNFIENINIDSDYNAIVLKHNPNNTDHTDYLLNFDTNVETEVLIIAGGGAGGTSQGYNSGGGGGAGEVLQESIAFDASMKYTIRVARGGFSSSTETAPAEEGKDSRIYNNIGQVIALVKGGGRGGFGKSVSSYSWPPTQGGSSGGRARGDNGVSITSSKYNINGLGNQGGTSASEAGGGGGAGGAGASGNRNPGTGYTSTITGTSTTYASGGYGGWQYGANLSDAGYGSGGAGAIATTNDTSISPGEYGNPGIIVIKYKKTFTQPKYNVISPILQSDTNNLIAKYSFEYNLNDASGNNHHLIGYNTYLTYVDKVYDNCSVLLNGTNGETYLEFPDTINLYNIWNDGDGLTFSIWFNMHSTTDEYGRILEFAYQTIKFNNESQYRLGIMRNLTSNYIQIYWKEDTTNGSATIPCDLNVWNNLVFAVNKQGLWSVYLNNIDQLINITFSPPNRTYNVKVLGRSSYSTTQNFNGLIDDFRIYNKVLSSNEIKILYESKFQTIYNINVPQGIFSDILLVGGGGSGGGTLGGGGGGGGVLYKSQNFIPTNNYVVRVGKGGDKVQRDQSNSWNDIGINGYYTSAMDTIVFGGGGGGNYQSISGSSGGSGGGGGFATSSGGLFIPPIYGNVIINGTYTGSQGESVASANKSGDGGNPNGVIYSITGTSYRYAKGGVGSENSVDNNRTNSHGINYGDGGGGGGWSSGTYSGDGGNGVCVFKYTLSTLSTSNYIITTPDTEKVSSGDLILINNGGIRRVFNTTSEHFTLYNEEQNDIGTIPSTATGFTKINNLLLFNVSGDIDSYSVYISNVSEYTKITIPITDIYTIKISAIFNLEFATEFCELYIRLDRSGYPSRYIRTFYLPPISSYDGHDSSTLNCSVDLNLQENDILVFESNYKLSSKLPSYITFTNSGTTIIQGSLIQNIISGSADSSLTFQSPLVNVDNTVSLDLSQITTNNLVFESPLVKFNNNVSISTNAYAQYSHKHDASDIHTGVLSIDRIPTLSTLYSTISHMNDTSNYINIIDAKTSNIDVINNSDINFNGNVNIGINTIYSANTKLYVKGTSSGYTQPLVKITQDGSWDGNYALEVDGYTNLGDIRINGADTTSSIYKVDAGNMTLTTNDGDIIFQPNGNVGIGSTNPSSKLEISNNSAPSANTTLLTLKNGNGTADLAGTLSSDISTNIDFVFTDVNATFTPQARIKCLNGTQTDGGINSEGSGNLCFYTGIGNDNAGGGILNEVMRLTYDDKVGIGITDPQAKLHVYVDSDTDNNLVEILCLERHCDDLSINANAEGGYISLKVDDDNASLGEVARISWRGNNADNEEDSGRLGFWTTKDDSCTEKLTITKEGDVGIGTTTPSSKLDVNGNINVNGTISALNLDITGSTTTIHTDTYTTESLHIQSSGADAVAFKITHDTTNHDIMEVNNSSGTQIFTIDSTGNVGIGNTSPVYKLDVDGVMRLGRNDIIGSHGKLIFAKRSSSSSARQATIGYNDSYDFCIADGSDTIGGQLKIQYAAPENTIFCRSNGNVGIGNDLPGYKLDVNGDVNIPSGSSFKINGSDILYTDSDVISLLNTGITGGLKVTSGNVGIGTGAVDFPAYKLDVAGSLNCTSLNVNGSPFTGSLWSTTSTTTSTSDIFYNDSTSITGTAYPQGSVVTISGGISDHILGSKMGLIVQHSNRTQGLGIGYNGISQCGSSANLHLHLKAKGTGTTKIGSSGGIGLDVSDSRVGIATSPTYQDAKLSINVGNEGTMIASPDISQFLWRINSTDIWGIYWSTNTSGNNYYISGDGNPNEIVFVGSGVARACVDLDSGSVCSKDWFRTFGNGGIYFSDHGGGWYMSDSTWIRNYGTKKVYINTDICADGNIGIGTTSPTQKLDVRGGMRLGDGTTAEQNINFVNNVGNWQVGINNIGNGTNSNQFFIYDSAYRLTVQNGTGNVGIGKTNPGSKLDVNGEIKCSSLTVNGVAITTNGGSGGSSNNGISITTSGSATNSGTSVSANIGIWSSTYAYIDLRTNNNSGSWIDFSSIDNSDYKVRLRGYNNPQKLEITTGSSVTTIDSGGNLLVPGDITAFYSDERLKKIKTNISDVLSNIDNINVFKYENNDLANSLGFKNEKLQIGLSAQEIQKYYPELVELAPFDSEYDIESRGNISKSGENYLTLKYDRLVPILLQGIKELNNKNKLLEERNNKLEKEIELIKKKLGL